MKKLKDKYKESDAEEILIRQVKQKSKGKFDIDKFEMDYRRKVANR